MKILYGSLIFTLTLMLMSGCGGKGTSKKESATVQDTTTVADTGFTGIKKYMSGTHLVMEATLKNGVKEGLMKTFYVNGKLRRTFIYKNGLREDTAKWFYEEGQLFRATPYVRDTIDGIQKQYFRTGKLKASIGFKKGFRTDFFEEFTNDGKLISGYPSLVVNIDDEYKSKGLYRILLSLTDKSTEVRFYRGEMTNGVFDTLRCTKINTINGIGTLDLKKRGTPQSGSVGVIAEVLTNYGNNYLIHKKIALPYKDLN